jgi:glycine cleavage system H protein
MKEIHELDLPDDIRYAENHEWARVEDQRVKVGISDYAQDQLGQIVFIELPRKGDAFQKGEQFGTVESVKAVSELYIPIGGEIVGVNEELDESPELVNNEAYAGGWMIEIKPDNLDAWDTLMDKVAYKEMLEGLEE